MAAPKLEPVRDRDYRAEMAALIDQETAAGGYVSALVAEHIVRKLTATDSDLLDGWLRAQAVFFVRHMINLRDCSTRTRARHQARRSEFAEAAGKLADGDKGPITSFLQVVHVIDVEGTRRRLAEMTAEDLKFVAADYDARAAENAMHAQFLKAIAKKVGKKTVGEVFDEPTLAEQWLSLSGN